MNTLTQEMKRSLRELDLGLKGELTITSDMEDLSNSLFFDQVKFKPAQKRMYVFNPLKRSNKPLFDFPKKKPLSGSPQLGQTGLCLPQWTLGLVTSPQITQNIISDYILSFDDNYNVKLY